MVLTGFFWTRAASLLACSVFAGHVAVAADRDVILPSTPAPLAGTLTMSAGGSMPGLLIVADGGATDRNGNQPGLLNDDYRKLAGGLESCGVATLRADKRGVALSGAAGPDEGDITVQTAVQDTLAWLDWLRHAPRIASVSVLGHGDGTLIATLAAQKAQVARLVLVGGAGRPFGDVLRERLASLDMAPVLRQRGEAMIRLLQRGETDADPPAGLATLFRTGAQPYLISELQLDPRAELAKTHVPALVVQGSRDLQSHVSDARALADSRGGIQTAIIPDMNHVLRIVPDGEFANFATYTDTSLPLAPALIPMLCRFLRQ